MTGWLSKAFRVVFLSVRMQKGNFCLRVYTVFLYIRINKVSIYLFIYAFPCKCLNIHSMWSLQGGSLFSMIKKHILFSAMKFLAWQGRGSPATSTAHLTCRNRPQECSLINLNYSFPDSAAPRSVVNPGFGFRSSECRLFRQCGPLNTFCQMLNNLNTHANYIHHNICICAPTYQCLRTLKLMMNNVKLCAFFAVICLSATIKILNILGI